MRDTTLNPNENLSNGFNSKCVHCIGDSAKSSLISIEVKTFGAFVGLDSASLAIYMMEVARSRSWTVTCTPNLRLPDIICMAVIETPPRELKGLFRRTNSGGLLRTWAAAACKHFSAFVVGITVEGLKAAPHTCMYVLLF